MNRPLRVLVVEDSEDDVLLMVRELKKGGYEPEYLRVESGEAMGAALKEKTWDLILCDYQMPKFNGLTAIALLKKSGIDIPLIIVSGAIGEEMAVECMRSGAHDYVMKGNLSRLVPAIERELKEVESRRERRKVSEELARTAKEWQVTFDSTNDAIWILDRDQRVLRSNRTAELFSHRPIEAMIGKQCWQLVHGTDQPIPECPILRAQKSLRRESMELQMGERWFVVFVDPILDADGLFSGAVHIVSDVTERKQTEKQLQDTLSRLRKAVNTTIQVMVSAVEARDPYTAGHQIRSADLALSIATEMGLPQDRLDGVRMAGSIHDIGKLSIPAEILSKPTKLSDIEFRLIREHARKGFELLKDVDSPWPLAEIVYQHHERMDGSGYPRNLKGEAILTEARILAVADTVEAMASHRPYRAGLGIDVALHEIEKNRGIHYDDAAVGACLRLFREKGFQLSVR